jgi:hypothetical protein
MRKLFFVTFLLIGIFRSGLSQDSVSVVYEYARVSTVNGHSRLYYENGSMEDLKKRLNIRSIYTSDSIANQNFFKINNYLTSRRYELVAALSVAGNLEYIYKRKKERIPLK